MNSVEELDDEPQSLDAAFQSPEGAKWIDAAKMDFSTLDRTRTLKPITPEVRDMLERRELKVYGTRAVLKRKRDSQGKVTCYKVRLVVQGHSMRSDIDYGETYAPCARMNTIRLLIAMAVQNNWRVTYGDIPNAYLNGKCTRIVLVNVLHKWNEIMGNELGLDGTPCIMEKSLYGSPESGRCWNNVLN